MHGAFAWLRGCSVMLHNFVCLGPIHWVIGVVCVRWSAALFHLFLQQLDLVLRALEGGTAVVTQGLQKEEVSTCISICS